MTNPHQTPERAGFCTPQAEGVDLATAAAIMGHKNASVLLDVYAQALKAPKRAAARRLEGALYRVAGGGGDDGGGVLAAG